MYIYIYIFNYIHVCYAFQGRSPGETLKWPVSFVSATAPSTSLEVWDSTMSTHCCRCSQRWRKNIFKNHCQSWSWKDIFWRKLRWIPWDSFGNLEGLGQWLHLRSRCLEISYHKLAVLLRKNCNFCMAAWCQVVANHPKCQFHIAYASQICHDRI